MVTYRLDALPGVTTLAERLAFLARVREGGRKIGRGEFLGDDVMAEAAAYRRAARVAASGAYLPCVEAEGRGFSARWRALEPLPEREAFYLDAIVRRAGRGLLESAVDETDGPHDQWLAALRRDEARLPASVTAEDANELARALACWRESLDAPAAERAALRFELVAPPAPPARPARPARPGRGAAVAQPAFRVRVAHPPVSRAGLLALGQAVRLFGPLRHLAPAADGALETPLSREETEGFLRSGVAALLACGYGVGVPDGLEGEHLAVSAELKDAPRAEGTRARDRRGGDPKPIAAKLVVRVDGEPVDADEVRFLLDQGASLVFFRDRWIEVDRGILREALKALEKAGERRLSRLEAASFAFGFGHVGGLRVTSVGAKGAVRRLLDEIRGGASVPLARSPEGLVGALRDYQLEGAGFLRFLASRGFGALLADDMGLGKTVQAIAFLLSEPAALPALVVAPVSVTANWMREFRRFAPGLTVFLHQGPDRLRGEAFVAAAREADVVVTGYSLLAKDFAVLSEAEFSTLVLDEAQTIRNPLTRVAAAARGLGARMRVALSGTPIENGVNDLWSLEEFLNPGLLGPQKEFLARFGRAETADALRRTLAPFMLRRLKTDPRVAKELGVKREIREYCTLAADQRRAYEDALAEDAAPWTGESAFARRGRVLALITRLKLICNGACKFARLDDLLAQIFAAGESALVFTQYAKTGAAIREHLEEEFGERYPFLHGGLAPSRREAEIAAFNGSARPNAFILSLRAGGFGLNLTRATHVIHFDRWWNPAVENQATDRAHRLGQAKDVFVHFFICEGTLEDHVDEILESKRRLAGEIVASGENALLSMDDGELRKVLEIR